MYKKLLAGEESMVHALSNAWLRNVLEVAKKLAVSTEGFEDIVQEGNMALFLRLSEPVRQLRKSGCGRGTSYRGGRSDEMLAYGDRAVRMGMKILWLEKLRW